MSDHVRLSVIVPALNEAACIAQTLEVLRSAIDPGDEILLTDGGSSDATVNIAAALCDRVVSSAPGRARQMNAGAKNAQGDVFLFLHADTRISRNAVAAMKQAVIQGGKAGRFRMRFDGPPSILMRFYESYTRFQFFSYGDQGFFVTRPVFELLQGYREDVPFEDLDFYSRLRKQMRPLILKEHVTTSFRRFEKTGAWRQKWINIVLVTLYYAGVDIEPLKKKWYPDVR